MMYQIAIVTTTLPDSMSIEEVTTFKSIFIEAKLAACVQSKKINSTYSWDENLISEKEWEIIFKTGINKVDELISSISKEHDYEIPQITHRIEYSTKEYSSWIEDQVS